MSNVSPASVRAAAAINACAAAGRKASGVLSSAWSAIRPPAVFQSSVAQAEDAAPPWPHPVRARIRAPAFEEIRNGPAWHRQIIHFHRLFHKGGIDRLRKA